MRGLRDRRVVAKLSIVALVSFLLTVAVGVTGFVGMRQLTGNMADLQSVSVASLEDAYAMAESLASIDGSLLTYSLASTDAARAEAASDVDRLMQQFEKAMEHYRSGRHGEDEQVSLDRIAGDWSQLKEAVKAYMDAGTLDAGGAAALRSYAEQLGHIEVRIRQHLDQLLTANHGAVAAAVGGARTRAGRFQQLLLIAVAAALVVAALTLWVAHTTIARPLTVLVHSVASLAEGDLTQQPSYRAGDEVGRAIESVRKATESLRGLVASVAAGARQLAGSSQELSATARQVGQSVQQVADTVNQMARSVGDLAHQAELAGKDAQQMGSAAQAAVQAAQVLSQLSGELGALRDQGRTTAAHTDERMRALASSVERGAEAISQLGRDSAQIGQIVDVITGIAEQTNLLALNAAIEAARAGEQGRGFAVVAEEVRKLAEQSRQAAGRIAQLIGQVQERTRVAVEAMDQARATTEEGVAGALELGKAFDAMAQRIEELDRQAATVQQVAKEVVDRVDSTLHAVSSMAAATQEAAAGAQEVSSTTEEQSAAVQHMTGSVEALARMAGQLLEAVKRFKVEKAA
ncbi:MAG: methyl-accepting chemotaxis protein [Limnochordaceae bacterium]|nr:methyl-accepting chemotaxis protein [Limnochordaceae bacterium]